MLHKIPVFTHILCAVLAFLCLCGCLCGVADSTVALPDSAEDGGAGNWLIRLSVAESATAAPAAPVIALTLDGQPPPDADSASAAVCITVDVPDGWRILSAEQGRRDDCMPARTPASTPASTPARTPADSPFTLTVDIRGARAVIVADGELKDLAGLAILLTLETVADACGGHITAACSEGIAFYNQARGEVDFIPVVEACAVFDTTDRVGQGTDASTDEAATVPIETTAPVDSIQDGTGVEASLIGCQETPCAEGTPDGTPYGTPYGTPDSIFSVRFIYKITGDGARKGTPSATGVVCLAGRGVITVEVATATTVTAWADGVTTVTAVDTAADPAVDAAGKDLYFLLVTFRGLSARGEWVFSAERGDGQRVLAHWRDGCFMGWTDG